MASDLQINIELAKALGWKQHYSPLIPDGHFTTVNGVVECLEAGIDVFYKRLDYRDPVVFVAICKHWGLEVVHSIFLAHMFNSGVYVSKTDKSSIERAAALCVIDLVKRGMK